MIPKKMQTQFKDQSLISHIYNPSLYSYRHIGRIQSCTGWCWAQRMVPVQWSQYPHSSFPSSAIFPKTTRINKHKSININILIDQPEPTMTTSKQFSCLFQGEINFNLTSIRIRFFFFGFFFLGREGYNSLQNLGCSEQNWVQQ